MVLAPRSPWVPAATSPSMHKGTIQGTAVSPGLALGPVHIVYAGPTDIPTWTVGRDEVPLEVGRLAAALNVAAERLDERRKKVASSAGAKDAEIFAVHRAILQDPSAMRQVENAITEQRINAEAAVKLLIDRFEQTMSKLEGNNVRAYASDVSDPWYYVLDVLLEKDREEVLQASGKVILAAVQLTPAVMTFVKRSRLAAVVTEKGGRFSHGAVLARAFGIPCLIGANNLLGRLEQGMQVAVDADRGVVHLEPSQAQVDDLLARKASFDGRRDALRQEAATKARTPDGGELALEVNIESVRDLETFDVNHVDGVGLLRTEFLSLERNAFPSEEEQFRLYRRVLEHLENRPATLRLLDIGGDKPLPYFHTPAETNPALGWRGIRITLQWRDLLRVQLRALLRASVYGELRVLVPMISSLDEVIELHGIFDEVREELTHQGYPVASDLPVGAMIEVPSALMEIGRIMDAVDFVSVGTNDLVQYLLAVDRDNPWVAELYDPYHPAVLGALERIAKAATASGKPAGVCGDIASDPAMATLLLGMGYHSISVAPQFVPEIKYAIRRTSLEAASALARQALSATGSEGVHGALKGIRKALYEGEEGR